MIKEAIISDYEIIEEIISNNYEFKLLEEETNTIREALTNYNKVVYIDYENEIPVAYAQCSLKNEANMVGYLEKIYIKHNYQNKGIDKKLLNKCEEWAKIKGCEKFTASCNLSNESLMDLFNHLGFSETDKIAYFSKELD